MTINNRANNEKMSFLSNLQFSAHVCTIFICSRSRRSLSTAKQCTVTLKPVQRPCHHSVGGTDESFMFAIIRFQMHSSLS